MLTRNVEYTERPDLVTVMNLDDGNSDVWMRKGISQVTRDDGDVYVVEEELYLRMATDTVPDDLESNFDVEYERLFQEIDIRVKIKLEEKIAQLEEQNALLEDCILEISEILYSE